jgi:hypothetical protein
MPFDATDPAIDDSGNPTETPTKVFGIGWAKTGTTTLGRCFEILGYNHQSQNLSLVPQILHGDLKKTLRIATAKDSFEDWPWPLVYREMDASFPSSRFVLTTRDPDRWLTSYRAMIAAQGPPACELSTIRCQLFGVDPAIASDEELVSRFIRHNAEILEYFKARSGQLLVVDWEAGDSWPKLCDFLGMPIPDVPFPHLNQRI